VPPDGCALERELEPDVGQLHEVEAVRFKGVVDLACRRRLTELLEVADVEGSAE
jgi:hypothetical protein